MKIVKAIKLSDDNIQEIWDCPIVYRISKLQLDPINEVKKGLTGTMFPITIIWMQGKEYPETTQGGWLVLDEMGYWRTFSEEDYEKLHQEDG